MVRRCAGDRIAIVGDHAEPDGLDPGCEVEPVYVLCGTREQVRKRAADAADHARRNGRREDAERVARLGEREPYADTTPPVRAYPQREGIAFTEWGGLDLTLLASDWKDKTVTNDDSGHAFEIEAATVDEFLGLLEERERDEAALVARRGPLRGAVFVVRTLEERSSRFGYPKVTRHVVAAFARGPDLVCCRRTTSSVVELPEIADTTEGRQLAAYEGMRAEIARGLKEAGLGVPLYEGCLRRVVEPDKS